MIYIFLKRDNLYRELVKGFNKVSGLVWLVPQNSKPLHVIVPVASFIWTVKPKNETAYLTHKNLLPKTREHRNSWEATGDFWKPIRIGKEFKL